MILRLRGQDIVICNFEMRGKTFKHDTLYRHQFHCYHEYYSFHTGSYLFPGPSHHYGPFHQRYPISFNGSLVRRIKIWSDGPPKPPQTRMAQVLKWELFKLVTFYSHFMVPNAKLLKGILM